MYFFPLLFSAFLPSQGGLHIIKMCTDTQPCKYPLIQALLVCLNASELSDEQGPLPVSALPTSPLETYFAALSDPSLKPPTDLFPWLRSSKFQSRAAERGLADLLGRRPGWVTGAMMENVAAGLQHKK